MQIESNQVSAPHFSRPATSAPFRGWVLTLELANGDTLELQIPRVAHLQLHEADLATNRILLTDRDQRILGRSEFDSWRERFMTSAARRPPHHWDRRR